MKLADFDYPLPSGCIAQRPAARRDEARLLCLPSAGECADRIVRDLPEILRPGDLLVLNDTRVFPARLSGRKAGGGRVEVLLLQRDDGPPSAGAFVPAGERADSHPPRELWRALLGASRAPGAGETIALGPGLSATVLRPQGGAEEALVALEAADGVAAAVERLGEVPLPPYIERPAGPDEEDRRRYQTVYAQRPGAAAAPTAGLHFTPELLARLLDRGIGLAWLTLHVGLGTFLPVRQEVLERHTMHRERFRLPEATAEAVERTRRSGGRVVAVGTTVVRVLEHCARDGSLRPAEGWCDLFIRPGFVFRRTDWLMTNFHLPRSTLLMLVCAFSGRERTLAAYRRAVEKGYRFYSYGDAMLLERAGRVAEEAAGDGADEAAGDGAEEAGGDGAEEAGGDGRAALGMSRL